MLKEVGRIVAVDSGHVWVETIQKSTCNSCAAQKGCGYGLLNETAHQRRNHLKVPVFTQPQGGFKVDDVVQLEFPEAELVKGALLIYILPLLAMLAMAAIASLAKLSEPAIMLAAMLGLLLCFVAIAYRLKLKTARLRQLAKITPLLTKPDQCVQAK